MPGMGNCSYAGTRWDTDISGTHADTQKKKKTRSQPLKDEAYTTDIHTHIQRYDKVTQNYSLCSESQCYVSKQDELNSTPLGLSRLTITNERFFDFLSNSL